eukprot:jgi/Ulvmu1/3333/UM155_0016.1
MTWGKVTRMYGLAQTLRRRAGQDPLNSFNDKDVTVLLYPPPRGNDIATQQTWAEAKKKHRIAQAIYKQRSQQAGKSGPTGSSVYEYRKPRMIWPEERLMWEVYRRNPELKRIPYSINSFEPPFAKRFALRQHELMQQGMSQEAAYRDTDKEMAMHKEELLRSSVRVLPNYSVIATIQEQEEQELVAAYDQYQKYR